MGVSALGLARLSLQEGCDVLAESRRGSAARQSHPLDRPKRLGHLGLLFRRVVNAHRHYERLAPRHEQRALIGKMPLETEVGFRAPCRAMRDHRHEQRAFAQLLPDAVVPGVATLELAAVEPHLDTGRAQRCRDAQRCRVVLGSVAQEDGAGKLWYRHWTPEIKES